MQLGLGEEHLAYGKAENATTESTAAIPNFRGMGKPGLEGCHKRLDKAGPHALTASSGTGADDSAKVVIEGNAEVPVSQPLPHILLDVEVLDEEHHAHRR